MGYRYRGPAEVEHYGRRATGEPCPDIVPSPGVEGRFRSCCLILDHPHDHYWVGVVDGRLELHRWDEDGRTTGREWP